MDVVNSLNDLDSTFFIRALVKDGVHGVVIHSDKWVLLLIDIIS